MSGINCERFEFKILSNEHKIINDPSYTQFLREWEVKNGPILPRPLLKIDFQLEQRDLSTYNRLVGEYDDALDKYSEQQKLIQDGLRPVVASIQERYCGECIVAKKEKGMYAARDS